MSGSSGMDIRLPRPGGSWQWTDDLRRQIPGAPGLAVFETWGFSSSAFHPDLRRYPHCGTRAFFHCGKYSRKQELSDLALRNSSALWKTLWKTRPSTSLAPFFQLFTQFASVPLHITETMKSITYLECPNAGLFFSCSAKQQQS